MREIGIIASEEDAKVLSDFLLTQDITTRLDSRPLGVAVWVHREDKVAEARVWLAEFQADPKSSRFQAAAKTAKEIRKKTEKVEREYQKKVKDFRERWEGAMYHRAPLAFGLIVVSVLVFLAMKVDWRFYVTIQEFMGFSTKVVDEDGIWSDTGFDAIRKGQVWRLITPIFVHYGIVHILFNMMAMRYLGERVEMRKGTFKFAILVLVSAITSNVGESLMRHVGYFGGMSGVMYAIAGYLWIKGHTDPEDHLSLDEANVRLFIGWFLLGIFAPMIFNEGMTENLPMQLGYLLHMANVAHGVGLATGIIFGLLRF